MSSPTNTPPSDESDLLKRITIEPGKRGGKPCVRGLRVTVSDVLGWLAAGMSHEDILSDFPYLERDDIAASLLYAARRMEHPLLVKPSAA